MVGTAANVNDVAQAHALVHGKEADVFGDAGYQGVDKREDVQQLHTLFALSNFWMMRGRLLREARA